MTPAKRSGRRGGPRFHLLVGGVVGVVGVAACASPTPRGAEQGCARFARATIEHAIRCSAVDRSETEGADEGLVANCVLLAGLPGSGLTADALDACAARLDDGCSVTGTASCEFPGSREVGRSCSDQSQCERGASCEARQGDCGVCRADRREGEACGEVPCGEGLVCGPGATCAREITVGEGASCASNERCTGGLVCLSGTEGAPRCVRLGQAGAPCTESSACAMPLGCAGGRCAPPGEALAPCADERACARDFRCRRDVCEAVVYVAAGEPCDAERTCVGSVCLAASPGASPTCRPLVPPGGACVAGECAVPGQCVGGTCRVVPPTACVER